VNQLVSWDFASRPDEEPLAILEEKMPAVAEIIAASPPDSCEPSVADIGFCLTVNEIATMIQWLQHKAVTALGRLPLKKTSNSKKIWGTIC
jgi:hypothetical protein